MVSVWVMRRILLWLIPTTIAFRFSRRLEILNTSLEYQVVQRQIILFTVLVNSVLSAFNRIFSHCFFFFMLSLLVLSLCLHAQVNFLLFYSLVSLYIINVILSSLIASVLFFLSFTKTFGVGNFSYSYGCTKEMLFWKFFLASSSFFILMIFKLSCIPPIMLLCYLLNSVISGGVATITHVFFRLSFFIFFFPPPSSNCESFKWLFKKIASVWLCSFLYRLKF